MRRRFVRWAARACAVWMWSAAEGAAAQDAVSVYRYVLDIDVPESAALVALDR